MTPKQRQLLTDCIHMHVCRCGLDSENRTEFEIPAIPVGDMLPGIQYRIKRNGVTVGTFTFSILGEDMNFVGKECLPVHPEDLYFSPIQIMFMDGPLSGQCRMLWDVEKPPLTYAFPAGLYHLVREPSSDLPQEIGSKFVYSVDLLKVVI